MKNILSIIFAPDTLKTSFMVGLVVGMILNLINQGDALIALDFENVNITKAVITFFVPFSVSTYSTVMANLKFAIGKEAAFTTELNCTTCNNTTIEIEKGQTIPACEMCIENTKWAYSD